MSVIFTDERPLFDSDSRVIVEHLDVFRHRLLMLICSLVVKLTIFLVALLFSLLFLHCVLETFLLGIFDNNG